MVNDTPRTPDHQQDDSTPHDGDPSTVVDGIDEFGTSVLEETSWGDRVDKAKKISTGLNRFNAGECPSNDDPGKFALIQEPTVIRKKDDHKLGYQVVLPKGYYGTMIVDEGPHPGAVISSVYEYHDLDPDLDRPEDLFGKTI